MLGRVLDPTAYSVATRVGSAAGVAHLYECGRQLLLNVLVSLVDGSSATGR